MKKVEDHLLYNGREYGILKEELDANKPIKLAEIEEIQRGFIHNNPHIAKRN
jgi:flagellar motor switch protein FliG